MGKELHLSVIFGITDATRPTQLSRVVCPSEETARATNLCVHKQPPPNGWQSVSTSLMDVWMRNLGILG